MEIGKAWINTFIKHSCFYRSVVIDWKIYDGSHFGNPFEPAILKKRRAYKKWAEMLIQPELTSPTLERIVNAELYLDQLHVMYGYDVISHLEDRFTRNYEGDKPYIHKFQHADARKDANQCVQLCDLLTGCLYQELMPSTKEAKLKTRDYLKEALKPFGVKEFRPEYWRGFDGGSLRNHFPKYSAWFWRPLSAKERKEHRKRK